MVAKRGVPSPTEEPTSKARTPKGGRGPTVTVGVLAGAAAGPAFEFMMRRIGTRGPCLAWKSGFQITGRLTCLENIIMTDDKMRGSASFFYKS